MPRREKSAWALKSWMRRRAPHVLVERAQRSAWSSMNTELAWRSWAGALKRGMLVCLWSRDRVRASAARALPDSPEVPRRRQAHFAIGFLQERRHILCRVAQIGVARASQLGNSTTPLRQWSTSQHRAGGDAV